MKRLFSPARKICDGLSFASKFFIVGVLLLLPAAVMIFLLVSDDLTESHQHLIWISLVTTALALYLLSGVFFSIIGTISSFVSAIDRFSKGDLAAQMHSSAKDEMGHIAAQFNEMRQNLKRTISRVSGSAAMVADAAAKLHDKAQQVTFLSQQHGTDIRRGRAPRQDFRHPQGGDQPVQQRHRQRRPEPGGKRVDLISAQGRQKAFDKFAHQDGDFFKRDL